MINPAKLEAQLDDLMEEANIRFLEEVPGASHLTDEQPLNERYYVRHRIETIKRIQMTAVTDALALVRLLETDYDAARVWARYACEELDHDRMFFADLELHGVSRAEVDRTPRLPATEELGQYLCGRINGGSALAAVAYSVFVEWNSERFSRAAVEKARKAFGGSYVEGSHSHLAIDETEDHYHAMVALAARLLTGPSEEAALKADLDNVGKLFRAYFQQLGEWADLPQLRAA